MLIGFGLLFWIYVIAAVLPAVVLLIYVYSLDQVEPEPFPLILRLLIRGVIAAVISLVLEGVFSGILRHFLPESDMRYMIIYFFIVVGAIEEGAKMLMLRTRTWNDPNFDYKFDGIVYAVAVSLGFAIFENIGYVINYGLIVAVQRAVLAVPAHMGFSVFMGIFYSRAKMYRNRGRTQTSRLNNLAAWIVPLCLHGIYDITATIQTTASTIIYIVFVVLMYIIVFNLVRSESKHDMHL